jgi:hypothetical protein
MARRGIRARLGLDSQKALNEWDERIALAVGVLAAAIIAGAIVGMIFMLVQVWRGGPITPSGNPLKAIFASRLMVAAARMALLFVGVYIAVSILVHMRRGQWLTAAGPLKVSESLRTLTTQSAERREQARALELENQRLRTTLAELRTELRTTERLLGQAQGQLRGKGEN